MILFVHHQELVAQRAIQNVSGLRGKRSLRNRLRIGRHRIGNTDIANVADAFN